MTPDRVLAVASRLLPAAYRDWGQAMRADLAGIDGGADRWRYALSCIRAVLTCGPTMSALTRRLPLVLAVAVAFGLAAQIPLTAVRETAYGMVLLLVGLGWLSASRLGFGRPGGGRRGRLIRGIGLAVVAAQALSVLVALVFSLDGRDDRAQAFVVTFTVVLASQLTAIVGLTGHRPGLTAPTMMAGVGVGLAAAALFTLGSLGLPTLPGSDVGPIAVITAAGLVAAVLSARRSGDRATTIAALAAAFISAHLIYLVIANVLPLSSRWVSNWAPPSALYDHAAYRLVDPVGELLLGALLAAALSVILLVRRRWRRLPVGPDQEQRRVAVAGDLGDQREIEVFPG